MKYDLKVWNKEIFSEINKERKPRFSESLHKFEENMLLPMEVNSNFRTFVFHTFKA